MARAPRRRVTTGDVAQRAGVSAQTVSNVVLGRNGFTEETRQRVLAAVEELGFAPNHPARSLRLQRSMQIGVDLASSQLATASPFTLMFLHALAAAAERHDYRLVVYTHHADSSAAFRSLVASSAVDGFILSDCGEGDFRPYELLDQQVPFVALGRLGPDLPASWVDVDNPAAMATVVDYLLARGHREFGYLGYGDDRYWTTERVAATRARLRESGLDLSDVRTVLGTPETVREAIRHLLSGPSRPSALITGSDTMAVLAMSVAASLGLAVGRDLAVTGFDGTSLRHLVEPLLTTMHVPVEDIAEHLMTRFVDLVEAGRTPRAGTLVDAVLTLGGSA